MENASKALLLSASVLIAIILIAIGISILGTVKPTVDQVGKVSTSLEVSIFNSQFDQYLGHNISASEARSMISKIIINNAKDVKHQINVKTGSLDNQEYGQEIFSGENIKNLQNAFSALIKYNVSIDSYDSDGYINRIYIEKI